MIVTIVSRVFAPEVSAASGLLLSWAKEFRDRGHAVTVVTVQPPRAVVVEETEAVRVRRFPVIRDRQNYVRGYLSYLSFDIPLVFRLLFSRRSDLYIVEPPPTTVAVVRVVAAFKRTPYVVDAADLWSDAAAMATTSRTVLRLLRWAEVWGLQGARHLMAAHEPLISRFRELGIRTPATAIGFGADTEHFRYTAQQPPEAPEFVYAGTYSEWHGAAIFLEAFAHVLERFPTARLRFIGNGQDRQLLRTRANQLGISAAVDFIAPIPPGELSPILTGATVSLASLKAGHGYDYAFTTKVYSSLAAGCPVIFAGVGPTVPFLRDAENPHVGVAVGYDVKAVKDAMEQAITGAPGPEDRATLSTWASARFSLNTVARTVVDTSIASLAR
jgi:glycosyltransferase involved in cell wall biosynthesis